jgi:predicted ATPase
MIATRVEENRAHGRRSINSRRVILRDREAERAVVGALLEGTRAGQGGGLLLQGEAGIGKTALLDYAIESAPDLRTLRATGVESEA